MDNQLILFEGHEVMILGKTDINFEIKGDYLISAKDVAMVLEYTQANDFVSLINPKYVYKVKNSDLAKSQNRKLNNAGEMFISSFGLYQGFSSSTMPKTQRFQNWLFEDMLPTVQKTGGYVANDDLFISTYLPHADDQAKLLFRVTLETVRSQNEKITVMQPKADYFDALVDRNLLTSFRTTAQELHVFEGKFIDWLLDEGYVYRDQKKELKAYAQHVPSLLDYKEWDNTRKAGVQTMITPKGRETFRLLVPMEIKK